MKPARDKWIKNRWPLIESRMSRHDCLQWMERNGYPRPPRSACVFCPFHSDDEWLRLKNEDPAAFADAVRFEKNYQNAIRSGSGFYGTPYLHRSLKPLAEVNFDKHADQMRLFDNECEGMCGV